MLKRGFDEKRLKHIFRLARGHFADTPEHRRMLEDVANDPTAFAGRSRFGNTWFVKRLADGSEVWVEVRGDVIVNGGINSPSARRRF